jgi:formylglycine-generating enzyme required for sulfatase activity
MMMQFRFWSSSAAWLLAWFASSPVIAQLPRGMARIEAGSFRPYYAQPGQPPIQVKGFAIDTVPVSLARFDPFAARRSRSDQAPGRSRNNTSLQDAAQRPATNVTWFAATTYCRARGARLPTTAEWEFVARASEDDRQAASGSAFKQRTLELALAADPARFLIGAGFRNVYGVRDLHGGVMEWTADFRTAAHRGARHDNQDGGSTCGAGTVHSGDASDYAAFLRSAFRAALTPHTTAPNLGFRCASTL